MILAIKNAIPTSAPEAQPDDVAGRIVRRTLAKREDQYASEVRRLLDAALEVIRRCGTSSRPRVADIVAEAGLSNDAFYRHFRSKDALVTAILEDGGERLRSYLGHQLAKESDARRPGTALGPGGPGAGRQGHRGDDAGGAVERERIRWGPGRGSPLRRRAPLRRCCTSPSPRWGARHPSSTPRSPHMPPWACSRTACGGRSSRHRAEVERVTSFCLKAAPPRSKPRPFRRTPRGPNWAPASP